MTTLRNRKSPLRYSFRLYVLCNGKRVLGKGGAQILGAIERLGSLSATAKELHMSYQFVWRYIRRMEARLGKTVILTRRGGTLHGRKRGGGATKLTPAGKSLLREYRTMERRLQKGITKSKLKLDPHYQ